MSKKYPKQLFVQLEQENTRDEYYNAVISAEKLGNGKIAIYELKEIKTKSTEIHIS